MNILFLAGADFFSGAERALLLTARALADAGHRPIVCTGTRGEFFEQLQAAGIESAHVPIRMTGAATLPAWLMSTATLARLMRRHRIDVAHANEAPSYQMLGYVARWLRVPAVTHVRFPNTTSGFAWYMKPGFARALFVSRYLEQDALSVAPDVFAGRTQVVYDGVSLPTCINDQERARRRAELGIPLDVPAVVIAGQVIEIKGIMDFIDAVRILRDRGVRASFHVLGDDLKGEGAFRREAERRAASLDLAKDITFLGFRSNAPELIPLFDVVTVPSHIEPLGNATLEAMAAARPVVGSTAGGIPEMIVEGETGWLVPPKSPARLADALSHAISDPVRAASMGAAGRARAKAVFGLEAHARNLSNVYSELCRGTAWG